MPNARIRPRAYRSNIPWESIAGSRRDSSSSPMRDNSSASRHTSSSHSKLPFSDTSSSQSSGARSPGPGSGAATGNQTAASKKAEPSRQQQPASTAPCSMGQQQEKRTSTPQHAPAHTAHDREHSVGKHTQHAQEQQPIEWHATTVLHCTYAMRMCCPERLLVSMAWADSRGEMLQQLAEEVPCASCSHEAQASVAQAWLCAQLLLRRSANLLRRPEGSRFEHLCVTLMPASECEQWVWMHVPRLLEAVALHGCVLPKRVTNICVAKAAVDDPVKHSRYMVRS
jgi:DNA mismatch repair ATPase MutL